MSIQAIEQFYDEIRANEALEKEANAAMQEGPAAVVALGSRQGFVFSEEELSIALARYAGAQEELSEDDLDLVAGGVVQPVSFGKDKTRSSGFGR